jgi:hypothetical protein
MVPADAAPDRKPRRGPRMLLLILALAIGIPLLIVGGVASLITLAVLTTKELPVTDDDKALLLTFGALARTLEEAPETDPLAESFAKSRTLDGMIEVTYEYDPPEEGYYVSCTATFDRTARDARMSYAAEDVGIKLGTTLADGSGEIRFVERNDLFRWGEQSRCALVYNGAFPVGNFILARKGTRVYAAYFIGIVLDDARTLRELLLPRLDKLEAYRP